MSLENFSYGKLIQHISIEPRYWSIMNSQGRGLELRVLSTCLIGVKSQVPSPTLYKQGVASQIHTPSSWQVE